MSTKSEFGTIRSEIATLEQRLTSEIGTLTTRSELDVLMSRQKQETLEQMQQTTTLNEPVNKDEQTTTLNEPVNKMHEKADDKFKVLDGQLCQVKSSVSTHANQWKQSKPHWMFK